MCCEIFISLATEQERREDEDQAHPSFKEDFRQAVICSPSFITFLTLVTLVCSERVTTEYVKWLHRHRLRLEMPLSPVSRICLWSCALLQIVQVNTLAAVDSSSSDSQKRTLDGLWLSLMLISEHWQDQLSWLGRTSRDQLHFDNRRIVHDSRLSTASLSREFISKARMCSNKSGHHPIKKSKSQ